MYYLYNKALRSYIYIYICLYCMSPIAGQTAETNELKFFKETFEYPVGNIVSTDSILLSLIKIFFI